MSYTQVLYVSSATRPISDSDVNQILTTARRENAKVGVTGMLLFCDNSFLQILEGPGDDVDAILSRIAKDPRHAHLRVLVRDQKPVRSFADWSMGFEKVEPNGPAGTTFKISQNAVEGRMTDAESRKLRLFIENFYHINTRSEINLNAKTPSVPAGAK
jgi:Sensors of blue-light using FAD